MVRYLIRLVVRILKRGKMLFYLIKENTCINLIILLFEMSALLRYPLVLKIQLLLLYYFNSILFTLYIAAFWHIDDNTETHRLKIRSAAVLDHYMTVKKSGNIFNIKFKVRN